MLCAEQETFMAKTGKQNRDTNNVIREMNEILRSLNKI